MANEHILVNKGVVTEIILNRPEKRNAVTLAMERRIGEILGEAAEDDTVKVVTITGNGPVFSAGHDLVEAAEVIRCDEPAKSVTRRLNRRGQFWWSVWEFPKPIVCGVHGYVGPVANVIVGCSDLCVAAEGTRFSWEQALIGGGPGFMEPLLMGVRRAKQVLLMDGWYSAEQGEKWGFVNKVVPLEQVKTEVREWAEKIARHPIENIMASKHGCNMVLEILGLRAIANNSMMLSLIAHGSDKDQEYFSLVREKGLKAGLEYREQHIS